MQINEFNRDTEYWNEFYRKNPPASMQESRFARFVTKYIEKNKTLIDAGCGNGRDSFFFNRLGLNVIGIDASDFSVCALNKISAENLSFVCGNFIDNPCIFKKRADYFYSRFTLHAIDAQGQTDFLKNVHDSLFDGGKLFIEVRSVHDAKFGQGEKVAENAFILDGHYRRFVSIDALLKELLEIGFSIKYAEEEKGFAPYKNEDSQTIRIVALKNVEQNLRGGGYKLIVKFDSHRFSLFLKKA